MQQTERRFQDDAGWVAWSAADQMLIHPGAGAHGAAPDPSLLGYFKHLLHLSRIYHADTGRHLTVYPDIAEVFATLAFGIAQNADTERGTAGHLGDDRVGIMIKTPDPDRAETAPTGPFDMLLLVRIDSSFNVAGRLLDRAALAQLHLPATTQGLSQPEAV